MKHCMNASNIFCFIYVHNLIAILFKFLIVYYRLSKQKNEQSNVLLNIFIHTHIKI